MDGLFCRAGKGGLQPAAVFLPGGPVEHQENVVPVGHAVEIQNQLVLQLFLVELSEKGGAQKPVLLVVEENEQYLFPQLLRHPLHQLAEGDHAGGVVVGGVLVGHAQEEYRNDQADDQNERRPVVDEKAVRHQGQQQIQAEGDEEKGDADQHAVQHRDQNVFRHDEVGKGQGGAGVVMGGEDELRRLPVPGHQVTVVDDFGLLHPQLGKMGQHETDKRKLLLFGFAHLPVRQEQLRK